MRDTDGAKALLSTEDDARGALLILSHRHRISIRSICHTKQTWWAEFGLPSLHVGQGKELLRVQCAGASYKQRGVAVKLT